MTKLTPPSPHARTLILSLLVASASTGTALIACSSTSTASIPAAGADGGQVESPDSGDQALDAGSGDAGITISAACADSAKARCLRNDTCSNGVSNKVHFGDETTCEARVAAQCDRNLGASATGATSATVESCAASVPAESCDQYLGNDPADSCLPPAGTLASGAACGLSAQCVSTYCAVPAHATCGVCAAVPAAGDACDVTGECGARGGLKCVNGACVVAGALNATCSKDAPCGPNLSCVTAKGATSGTCQAAVAAAGATCDPKKETGPGCDTDLGLFCDPTTSQCVAYGFATDGQPCGAVGDGFVACTAGTCILGTVELDAGDGGDGGTRQAATGVCKANAADGTSCDTDVGPACESPAKCVTSDGGTAGTCVLPDPTKCN